MNSRNSHRRDFHVLRAIYFLRTPTRSEIARYTGHSHVSVTKTLNKLLGEALIDRAGKNQGRSGRPSATYQLSEKTGYSVGITFDAEAICLVALDARHQIAKEEIHALSLSADPSFHSDEILQQVFSSLRQFLTSKELKDRRGMAIGIAPPGMVDTERGIWLQGLQVSGITHVPLGEILGTMFGVTILVEDAARCLAYLEAVRRPANASRDLVYLYLGSGVGMGIMAGEEPYYGSHGMAGEIGHLVVEEDGARCICGNIGCLETVVSSYGILRRFQQRLSEGVISTLQKFRNDESLSLAAIRDAASSGDRLAQSTLFELGTLLGDAASKVIKLCNPRTLVVGGPVGLLGEHLREPLWIKIKQKVIPEMLVDLSVEIAPSQPRDEAIGAAYLAERRFWKEADERSSLQG